MNFYSSSVVRRKKRGPPGQLIVGNNWDFPTVGRGGNPVSILMSIGEEGGKEEGKTFAPYWWKTGRNGKNLVQ